MFVPECTACGETAGWTGKYLVNTTREWEVRPSYTEPNLVDEDEDNGFWDEIRCVNCDEAASPDEYAEIIEALTGGA